MKKLLLILLAFTVAFVFAQITHNKFKSKKGDINLMSLVGGGEVVCTARFNDTMTALRQVGGYILVQASCGQGWVNSSDVEKIVEPPPAGGMKIDAVDAVGWMDNPSAVFVLDQNASSYSFDLERNEEYGSFAENRFRDAKSEPLSTFSLDVDAASYSNVRRMINQGKKPDKDAVRIEELINYFSYNYPSPTGELPISIVTETQPSPWNKDNLLVRIGVKAKEIPTENLPPSNFVFLTVLGYEKQTAFW